MYTLLFLTLISASIALIGVGSSRRRPLFTGAGVVVVLGTFSFFALLSFWSEMLWFDAVSYGDRFWTALLASCLVAAVAAAFGGLVTFLLARSVPDISRSARRWPPLLGATLGLLWGVASWPIVLAYWYRVDVGLQDPVLGRDTSFYLFTLPLYDALWPFFATLAVVGLVTAVGALFVPRPDEASGDGASRPLQRRRSSTDFRPAYLAAGALALVVAWGQYLNVFHLMYSARGAVSGAGWTDVTIRLPAYGLSAAIVTLLGLALLVPALSSRFHRWAVGGPWGLSFQTALTLPVVLLFGVWGLATKAAPALSQWLVVEPNEISLERPYIANNIQFTRRGFQLDNVDQREFTVSQRFDRQTAEANRHVLSQIRLWDPRALVDVYKQFQEIRLYYEFPDVDIDRYLIDGTKRQVMVSTREMSLANLPEQSKTFVNRHFKYTHGYGLTMAPVSKFTNDGLPDLYVKDLPPEAARSTLEVQRPEIYYGMLTDTYVIANSEEREFNYPKGDSNVYTRYEGEGGVRMEGWWRKFVFGWTLGGTKLLFSGYPRADSRVMFRRQIRERVSALAPFLTFDRDPYAVLSGGKLYWIVDAYTTSRYYPYSEPFFGGGSRASSPDRRTRGLDSVNYVRNAVKAVVDAYDGTVEFYVFEPDDPIIKVWRRVYPNLFQGREDMPNDLIAHIRYPEDLLRAQAEVFSKYHMTDPAVFYNQEDLWVRATEKYYARVQAVEPYYVMWQPPDSDDVEFVLMLPFTPKNRQVLIGWIAGMCDPDNYGRLVAYRFPKERRVLGTQQVETKIDQDSYLSGQLTLWDQRGSNVIRGNVLVIPIDDTLLYVEPIYLQAEAAAYPELRLVALMHNDQLSYAETFDEALEGLFDDSEQPGEVAESVGRSVTGEVDGQIRRANRAFEDYIEAMGQKRFDDASQALKTLRDNLQALMSQPNMQRTVRSDGS